MSNSFFAIVNYCAIKERTEILSADKIEAIPPMFCRLRDSQGLASSEVHEVIIRQGSPTGDPVAIVSYNGRLWSYHANWQDRQLISEAPRNYNR